MMMKVRLQYENGIGRWLVWSHNNNEEVSEIQRIFQHNQEIRSSEIEIMSGLFQITSSLLLSFHTLLQRKNHAISDPPPHLSFWLSLSSANELFCTMMIIIHCYLFLKKRRKNKQFVVGGSVLWFIIILRLISASFTYNDEKPWLLRPPIHPIEICKIAISQSCNLLFYYNKLFSIAYIIDKNNYFLISWQRRDEVISNQNYHRQI